MKKVFKLAAIAAIATLTLAACNNNQPATEDSIAEETIEQIVDDEMIAEPAEVLDTTPVVKETKTTAKTTTKKAEPKVQKATEQPAQTTTPNTESIKTVDKTPQTAPLKRTR